MQKQKTIYAAGIWHNGWSASKSRLCALFQLPVTYTLKQQMMAEIPVSLPLPQETWIEFRDPAFGLVQAQLLQEFGGDKQQMEKALCLNFK